MSVNTTYVIEEKIDEQWVLLGRVTCPLKATSHLEELKVVAPESSAGARYRVIKSMMNLAANGQKR